MKKLFESQNERARSQHPESQNERARSQHPGRSIRRKGISVTLMKKNQNGINAPTNPKRLMKIKDN